MMRSSWIDEELAMLADQTARILARDFVPHIAQWERDGRVDRESWRRAGAAGLLCASIPTQYGGAGGTLAHEAVIAQEFARSGVGSSIAVGVHSAIVARYILAYGDESQKHRWLPRMATGEIVAAIAMTEPGAGSDLQAVRTVARAVDGGYRISGQKTFISNGQNADLIITVCKTEHGISLLVVEPEKAQGFQRGRNLDKIGMAGQDTSELFFDDVFVPQDSLLGAEGRGFISLKEQLSWERLYIALGATVAMERALELTVEYVKDRKAFGKTLFDFQNTQFKLAECKALACVARTLIDAQMAQLLNGSLDPVDAAIAKLWCTETQGRVVDECLQLFGGYGYMTEYPIAKIYADARVTRIFGGASEIMKLIISRSL